MESLAYLVKETILEPIGHGNLLRSSNQGHIHRQTIWLKWEEIFEENVCEEVKGVMKENSLVRDDYGALLSDSKSCVAVWELKRNKINVNISRDTPLFEKDNDEAAFICRLLVLFVYFLLVCRIIPEKFLTMAEEHKFLAKVQSFESIFFILLSLTGLLIKPHELIVVGAMILTKVIGTVGFILPHLIRRTGMKLHVLLLFSLFEPALLALLTGVICYWQYYFLRGQLHEFFLLVLAGISGVLIYFPALYYMMFDHAEKIRAKRIIHKFTGKLRRA